MSRAWSETRTLNVTAIWLPCGVQNYFNPAVREDSPKVMLEGEINLVQHFRQAKVEMDDPKPSGWRNLYFSWTPWNGQYLYTDSDGFIIAAGEKPELPQLVTPDYWVQRSKGQPSKSSTPDISASGPGEPGNFEPPPLNTMLTNFQMNLLFEGIWNSAADPRVFLLSSGSKAIEQGFAFNALRDELIVKMGDVHVDMSMPFPVSLRRLIFLQAIRSMRNEHLLPLKWNIEAARRHLFSETMTMLHRPESLQQYISRSSQSEVQPTEADEGAAVEGGEDTPGAQASKGAPGARDMLFAKSSDEQLRGYVMLVSAKLPLIDNLTFLIGDCWEGLALDSELNPDPNPRIEPDRQGIPRVIHDVVATWKGTADALHKNVEALERSFANIWQDKLLHETEQVRVEEEALGELQRQQARNRSDRWFDTLIFVVTLAVAGAALFFSINGADPLKNHKTTVFIVAGIIVVVLTVGFWVVPKIVTHFVKEFIPRYEYVARLDEPLVLHAGNETDLGLDWMNIPFSKPVHDAIGDNEDAKMLNPRWRLRLLSTKKMKRWIGLPCFISGRDSGAAARLYPVGIFLDDESPRIRIDSPGEIDTYSRIHLDIRILLPKRRWTRRLWRQEMRPILRNVTGWVHRLIGSYYTTFPSRCVTVECAIELHKHSPGPGNALYFLRELRLIMSSRAELERDETLMCTLIVDFLLVKPWVYPYSGSEERRNSVRKSLLTDRLETSSWRGSVLANE